MATVSEQIAMKKRQIAQLANMPNTAGTVLQLRQDVASLEVQEAYAAKLGASAPPPAPPPPPPPSPPVTMPVANLIAEITDETTTDDDASTVVITPDEDA